MRVEYCPSAQGRRDDRVGAYETPREDVGAHVPRACKRILDLGCSSGALGAALKREPDVLVVGVELDAEYAAAAATRLDRVVVGDVEAFLRAGDAPDAPFDCLIAADVLEHLVDPWGALARATDLLAGDAAVVISVPNVNHWRGLVRLAVGGRWPRDDHGPFDATHLRWFTRRDAVELLQGAGIACVAVEPRYWMTGWRLKISLLLARLGLERFLAVQYVLSGIKSEP